MPDKKALQILFATYWNSKGWKDESQTSAEDLEYAKAAGYMFEPTYLSHDDSIEWLKTSFKNVTLDNITNAFLSSLSTRRLDLRSALGSYAVAKNFPVHKFSGERYCEVCGLYSNNEEMEDLNVLNFERYKWGGVRHDDPNYIALDLELFAKAEKVQPVKEDLKICRQIIEFADNLQSDLRPRDLEKKLSRVLRSNKEEREILLQILAYCGILQPKEQLSFFTTFVPYVKREIPPVSKIDWSFPINWWRGSDKINQSALNYYFHKI